MTLPLISTRSTELPTWRQRVAETINNLIPREGTYTATLTGVGSTVTGTVRWIRHRNKVTLFIPENVTGTSNANSMSMTGMPEDLWPQRAQWQALPIVIDNGAGDTDAGVIVQTDGVLAFTINGSTTGFTSSGTKGTSGAAGSTITYLLT